jgi:hypothetical protein
MFLDGRKHIVVHKFADRISNEHFLFGKEGIDIIVVNAQEFLQREPAVWLRMEKSPVHEKQHRA